MSYLLDRQAKRKTYTRIAVAVLVLAILFIFRVSVFSGLSYVSQKVFGPVLSGGNSVGEKFKNFSAYFASKSSLDLENQNLQKELDEARLQMVNYSALKAENESLKEILGRKNENIKFVLSAILAKPNKSLYDTLLIDAGLKQNVKEGDVVFALGNIPIGRIGAAYDNSSKVILFSNPGEKTEGVVSAKNISMELAGRGGGNFEMIIPRDVTVAKGDEVTLPGINSYIVAIVQTVISDPRDPFTKALLTSPVNVQELRFVQIAQ